MENDFPSRFDPAGRFFFISGEQLSESFFIDPPGGSGATWKVALQSISGEKLFRQASPSRLRSQERFLFRP